MKKVIGLAVIASSFTAIAGEWSGIKPSADFRLRNENTTIEDGDSHTRLRLRARFGLDYKIEEGTMLHSRFISSEKPTSGNQDLDTDDNRGALYIDRAYVSQKLGEATVNFGKMKNQFSKVGGTQLIWDDDVNHDGIHAAYSTMGAYLNIGSFNIDQVQAGSASAKTDNDITLLASQLGYKGEAGSIGYHVGVSNYHYQGWNAAKGGTEGMNMLETYVSVSFDVVMPVEFFFTAVTNDEAEELNRANAVGINIGNAKKKGQWSVGYEMRTIDSNSVYTGLSDSNFANNETDSSGSVMQAKYKTTDKSYLKVRLFSNKLDVEGDTAGTTDEAAFSRLQFDYGVKF